MWSTVELREIRAFLTLAEELHFGRTADRLSITSSRVSQILSQLEAKLGVRLVHRTSRRVRLTSVGERLRDELSETYAELTATLEQIEQAGRSVRGMLRIGTFSAPATGPHFLRILRAFGSRRPDCVVDVEQLKRPEPPFDVLEREEFDIVAVWLPAAHKELVVGPILNTEPRVLAMSPDHPLARRESVSIEDVADCRVVRLPGFEREFHEAWVPSRTPSGRPIPRGETLRLSAGTILELGYLIASGRVVHPTVPSVSMVWGNLDIVYVPISDMPPMRSALVWRRDAADTTVREFVRTAEDVLRRATRVDR